MSVIDIAWARPDPSEIAAKGYTGVIGYISRDASKCMSRAYIDACHAHGLDVGFVFEDAADRARQGAPAGQADGQFIAAHFASIGAPAGVACYMAVDYAAPASDHPAIVAYFQAGAAAMRPHPSGAYGDADVDDWARAGGIPLEWGTVAWSGGRQSDGIALFQRAQQDFGGSADVDEVRQADWGQWRAVPLPPPPPVAPHYVQLQEGTMANVTISTDDNGGGYADCAGDVGKIIGWSVEGFDPEAPPEGQGKYFVYGSVSFAAVPNRPGVTRVCLSSSSVVRGHVAVDVTFGA